MTSALSVYPFLTFLISDAFRGIFKNVRKDRKLTLPTIHVYGFSKAEDPEFDFHEVCRTPCIYLLLSDFISLIISRFLFRLSFINFSLNMKTQRIRVALEEAAVSVDMRRVRAVAPGKWMLCASFVLPEKVAFSKEMDNVDCK